MQSTVRLYTIKPHAGFSKTKVAFDLDNDKCCVLLYLKWIHLCTLVLLEVRFSIQEVTLTLK